ncbi:MAG: Aminopeptidase 2 [Candidatus Thorarchaeota archaeon]|nr:MAG: Aminopeptidase 2 [Candidatus Thorarchaeota archaeon]
MNQNSVKTMDPRIEEHAKILVEWSTEVKKGDMVVIRATPHSHDLAVAITQQVAKAGGSTVVLMDSEEITYGFYKGADDDTLKLLPEHLKSLYEKTDVLIALRSPVNTRATSNVDPKRMMTRNKATQEISEIVMEKRWCLTVHPCATLAQQGNMSMDEYQDFAYGAMLIDWKEASKNMYLIKEHLEKHKDVRFTGPETDLYAKTEGRIWIASDGKHNMPSGEVFTAPIEDTVEGKIYFDIPFMQQGKVIEGVRLTFEKGQVVDYSVEKNEEAFEAVLETDEGSRYLGEMAIGTNRGIKDYTLNMLFDEKIGDTIHCALGRAYKDCKGTNESAVHVDMIKTMIEGEITAGDEVIYSKGKFFFE